MELLAAVEAHLVATWKPPEARAAVTFVGAAPVEILRFGPGADGVVHYATLGMSVHPMTDPADLAPDPVHGPRAELFLSIRQGGTSAALDTVARRLAVLAMTPFIEGVVIRPGVSLDLTEPLWDGAAFTAVLVGDSGEMADLELPPPADPVRFLPVLPMTPTEAAWKRVHGAEALQQTWQDHNTDLRDPDRRAVLLDGRPGGVPG